MDPVPFPTEKYIQNSFHTSIQEHFQDLNFELERKDS